MHGGCAQLFLTEELYQLLGSAHRGVLSQDMQLGGWGWGSVIELFLPCIYDVEFNLQPRENKLVQFGISVSPDVFFIIID